MNYLEEANRINKCFIDLLTRIHLQGFVKESNRKELYTLTGEMDYLYGHAFIEKYDMYKLSIICSIKELIIAFTYTTFSLSDEDATIGSQTDQQVQQLLKDLQELIVENHNEDEDNLLDIDLIKEKLVSLLQEENISEYNRYLQFVLQYGEQKNKELLDAAYGAGDDNDETDDYEFTVYESDKEATQLLEYYTNKYNDLIIEGSYNKETLIKMINEIE